jgi:DNA polymerase III subunit epsilon
VLFRSPPWDSAVYWALDLETGGLDPRRDPILAVGMVPVRGGTIRLREGYRTLVRPDGAAAIAPASVQAHQLVRSELRQAPPLEEVLPEVDRRLRQGVLLVHHAAVDVAFLRREYRRLGLRWPSRMVIDTERLLVRHARATDPQRSRDQLALNLAQARAEHDLPEHQEHDPLSDAVATAELFLALRIALGARTVRDLRG